MTFRILPDRISALNQGQVDQIPTNLHAGPLFEGGLRIIQVFNLFVIVMPISSGNYSRKSPDNREIRKRAHDSILVFRVISSNRAASIGG